MQFPQTAMFAELMCWNSLAVVLDSAVASAVVDCDVDLGGSCVE